MIDFFVSRNLSSSFMDVTEEIDLDSDHSPIFLTLSETIIKKDRNPAFSIKLTDWDMFREKLENRISLRATLQNNDEMEEDVQIFVTDIQPSAWEATPLLTKKGQGKQLPKGSQVNNCRKTKY